MKAIILNFCTSRVEVAKLPNSLLVMDDNDSEGYQQTENIERYMQDELGVHLSDILYMITEDQCEVCDLAGDHLATI